MRIGIDASRAAVARRTGTEAYAYHLIRALLPIANARQHQVTVYYNQSPSVPISAENHLVQALPFPRLWTHIRLAAHLLRQPPDVFFTPAHVIPLSYMRPAVATVHDLGYHYFPQSHTPRQLRQLRWSTRHNARRSQHVIADSEATKRDLVALYQISAEKINVIYPGFDTELRPVTDENMLADLQKRLQITSPYFLFLSTLQPRKNIGRIIEAFAQVAAEVPQQLVLAGKQGWLAEPLLNQIAELPLATRERIRLTGFIDDSDKAALISGATALVYPSQYEGFGFPVLEAQACGTPVITADNSSLVEVGGDAVHFVSAESTNAIANAMRQLANDTAYRHQLIVAGNSNIKRFSWQRAAAQTLDLLEQVAGVHA